MLNKKSKYKEVWKTAEKAFGKFTTDQLVGVNKEEFRAYVESRINEITPETEGYSEAEMERQRDLSIKFHWGHDHDFGDFKLAGKMRKRHFRLMANFCTYFPIELSDFKNKDVFDIGCWTGGTTLLLTALGSRVLATEEVNKYADMTSYLIKSFGLDQKAKVLRASLYECNSEDFYDKFDIVYFPGVLYHLTDPVIALRHLYNACKIGGTILVESFGIDSDEPICRFDGSLVYGTGDKESLTRSGWNWFIPSASTLERMLREAGFEEIESLFFKESSRIYAYAKKATWNGICRAGLSQPDIK
jgi:SAM-dependent methyltransferase